MAGSPSPFRNDDGDGGGGGDGRVAGVGGTGGGTLYRWRVCSCCGHRGKQNGGAIVS